MIALSFYMVNVEIIYIKSDHTVIHLYCHVTSGATVEDALNQSGIIKQCPEVTLLPVGIFSKQVERTTVLKEGDRIELYRPLLNDPKEKRRQRAKTS